MRLLSKESTALLLAKALITAVMLWLITRGVDVSLVAKTIDRISLGWLALAFSLFVIQLMLNSWRWCLLVPLDGGALRFPDALRIYLEGSFFNQALPTSLGGDVVRIYRAAKLGQRLGQAVNGVLLDRIAGSMGLVILMIGGLIPFLTMTVNRTAKIAFAMVPAIAVLGLIALVVVSVVEHSAPIRLPSWFLHFARLVRRMLIQPSIALPALGLAVAGHTAMVTGAWLLARSGGIAVDWIACFTIVPAAILISMIPISVAGWGVRESVMATGFALIGVGAEAGLFVSLGVGLVLLVIGLIGGVIWFTVGASSLRTAPRAVEYGRSRESQANHI